MYIECPICSRPCSDREFALHHIRTIEARLYDKARPVCDKFVLRKYRGIDGVADFRGVGRNIGPLFERTRGEK